MPDTPLLPLDDLPPLPGEADGADHPDDADLPALRAVSKPQHDFAYGTRRRVLAHCRDYLAQAEALVAVWLEKGEPQKAAQAEADRQRALRGFEKLRKATSASWWLEIRKTEPHALLMGLGEEE